MKKLCLGLILASLLTSCSSSHAVYVIKDHWQPAPKQSQITGWTYIK